MIEVVSQSRCIACDICVAVCPENVFDAVPNAPPAIARKADCQTCFMCELYCPTDALYVSPLADRDDPVNEAALLAAGLFGSYQRALGWKKAKPGGAAADLTYRIFEDGTVRP